jgi:hypothetical protein
MVVTGAANIAGDGPSAFNEKLNGRHFGNGAGAAGSNQYGETKPILRPDAE